MLRKSGLQQHVVSVAVQVAPLPFTECPDAGRCYWIHPHAPQGVGVCDGGDDDLTVVLEGDESPVEEVID